MFKRLFDSIRKAAGKGNAVSATHWDGDRDELHAEIEFRILVTEDEVDGGFVVECLNLPGCMSQGDTVDEAVQNIGEAIAGVLAARFERSLKEQEARSAPSAPPPRELSVPLMGSERVPA